MKEAPSNWEGLREEAVAYAKGILEGFKESQGRPAIAETLRALAHEYDAARREKRGMDPRNVRNAVQHLIDVAKFHANNEPEIHDPDRPDDQDRSGESEPLRAPLFHYQRRRGHPESPDISDRVAYAVGAVAGRFGLTKYRNDEKSPNRRGPRHLSACDVVAAANTELRLSPRSFSGIRNCIERDYRCELICEDGQQRGASDKELA